MLSTRRLSEIVINTAKSNGVEAELILAKPYPITFNDLELTEKMKKTLFRVAGDSNVKLIKASTGAEDFSFFANEVRILLDLGVCQLKTIQTKVLVITLRIFM